MKSSQHLSSSAQNLIQQLWVTDNDEDYQQLERAIAHVQDVQPEAEQLSYGAEVAIILSSLSVDQTTLIAAILSDRDLVGRLSDTTLADEYGDVMMTLVKSVRGLNKFTNCDNGEDARATVPEQAERIRRMILSIVDDIRAVLIKLAWRLHLLRILGKKDVSNKKRCVAQETLDIFAPLANRLGIHQMKWEMEDLSFHYLDPFTYKEIAKDLNNKRIQREAYIDEFVKTLQSLVTEMNIEATIYGRPKHIYSIYKKLQSKNRDSIDQLYDLRAIRIITDETGSCYKLLGEIHARWKYIRDEYDDYIANKKANGYQSLHTVIYGPEGNTVEIQIRTHDMHAAAELGVAAHWRYKDGSSQDSVMQATVATLRGLLAGDTNDKALVEDFHSEVFSDRVFALTPKGEVMDLPKLSTPLDFAYAVHTSVGHRCSGAKVNGKMVPLTYTLKNAEQVEILTQKEENPKRKWLNPGLGYLQSAKARNAVRHWLRQQNYDINKRDGLAVVDREIKRLAIADVDINALVEHFRMQRKDELLIAIGRGDIGAQQVANAISPPQKKSRLPASHVDQSPVELKGVQVEGVGNILINIANCCKPVPGDEIVGYITLGRGVSIHRQSCPNINLDNLSQEQHSRLVVVSWGEEARGYSVDIHVAGLDRPGLLSDATLVLASERVNILDVSIQHEETSLKAVINITVQVNNTNQLELILKQLSKLPSVLSVRRA